MKHPLTTPLSVAQIAPTTGVFGTSEFMHDREGFIARVMLKWMSQQNAQPSMLTMHHYCVAEHLHSFYVDLRQMVDALTPDDNPKRALLQVSIHELIRGGTVDDAANLLRKHAQFIAHSGQVHDADPLICRSGDQLHPVSN